MSRGHGSRLHGARARRPLALVVACLLACITVHSGAAPPGLLPVPPGPATIPCTPDDSIAVALCTALQAYTRGEFAAARSWAALASQQLAGAASPTPGGKPYLIGNASQLLEMLQLYRLYAAGRRADLDAQYAALVPLLEKLDVLSRDPLRPDHLGPEWVEHHLITHLVTRIGDVTVDYHLITQQITRVGDLRIDYNLHSGMPTHIGDITFDYNPIDGRVTGVAGVEVR